MTPCPFLSHVLSVCDKRETSGHGKSQGQGRRRGKKKTGRKEEGREGRWKEEGERNKGAKRERDKRNHAKRSKEEKRKTHVNIAKTTVNSGKKWERMEVVGEGRREGQRCEKTREQERNK